MAVSVAAFVRAGRDDEVGRLRRHLSAAEARLALGQRERDRLRLERDRLEAQLASEETPAACPRPYVRTPPDFALSIEHPCAWHLLYEPLNRPSDPRRRGLVVDLLFLSATPIDKTPRGGPLADIEIAVWSDDPTAHGDALPSFADWVRSEAAALARPSERRSRLPYGQLVRLSGTTDSFGEPASAIVYLWEYADHGGRHVVRMFLLDPPAEMRRAADLLARSFRPPVS